MNTIPHTLKELAQRAIDVQGASNLLGVVRSMHADLSELRTSFNLDSAALHGHPIARLWADKIRDLTGINGTGASAEDWNSVYRMANGESM